MYRWIAAWAWMGLGCAGSPGAAAPVGDDSGVGTSGTPVDTGDTAEPDETDPDHGGWDGEDTWDPAEPTWTAEDVEERVNAALAVGLPTPAEPLVAWTDFLELAVALESQAGDSVVLAEDQTPTFSAHDFEEILADGSSYSGGWIYSFERAVEEDQQSVEARLLASVTMIDAQGHTYEGGGEFTASVSKASDGEVSTAFKLGGLWSYGGGEGWLERGASTGLTLESSSVDEAVLVEASGGIGYADITMYLEGVTVDSAVCPDLAPTGTLLVRDPSFYWIELELSDECTGCATVAWDGEEIGEACVGETLSDAIFLGLDRMNRL